MNLHHDGYFLISHFNHYGANSMIRTQNPGHFLRFKRLSDDFLSITTRKTILNLLSLLDDNYISGYPARQIRGAPWSTAPQVGLINMSKLTRLGMSSMTQTLMILLIVFGLYQTWGYLVYLTRIALSVLGRVAGLVLIFAVLLLLALSL